MDTLNRMAKDARLKKHSGLYLLTTHTRKAEKGLKRGKLQAMLNLQPCYAISEKQKIGLEAWQFKFKSPGARLTTCPFAGLCCSVCLSKCGHNAKLINKHAEKCRIRKTDLLLNHTDLFMRLLESDLKTLQEKATTLHLKPVCRLNCLSDLWWPDLLFTRFPNVQFLDYTKNMWKAAYSAYIAADWPKNYHLTYSWSERDLSNPFIDQQIANLYRHKTVNVAVIFNKDLPKTFTVGKTTYPVIDGDIDDLRFLDKSGAIVGLRFKTPRVRSGFKPGKHLTDLVVSPNKSPV